MKQILIGLTLAASLTAGGAWAEDEPVGRYTTIAVKTESGEDKILVTDTQRGRLKVCWVVLKDSSWKPLCSKWQTFSKL